MPPSIKRRVFKREELEDAEVITPKEKPEVSKTRRRPKPEPEDDDEPEVTKEKFDVIGSPKKAMVTGVPCVSVEKGVTKNMGDYNSAKVTIGMMLPLDYTPEDLKKAEKAISVIDKIIVQRLEDEVSELLDE